MTKIQFSVISFILCAIAMTQVFFVALVGEFLNSTEVRAAVRAGASINYGIEAVKIQNEIKQEVQKKLKEQGLNPDLYKPGLTEEDLK